MPGQAGDPYLSPHARAMVDTGQARGWKASILWYHDPKGPKCPDTAKTESLCFYFRNHGLG